RRSSVPVSERHRPGKAATVTADPGVEAARELAIRIDALQLADYDYWVKMAAKARADALLHHAMRQVRYLVWYQVGKHGLFSIGVDHTLAGARENRDGFIEDGYP